MCFFSFNSHKNEIGFPHEGSKAQVGEVRSLGTWQGLLSNRGLSELRALVPPSHARTRGGVWTWEAVPLSV